MTLKPIVASVFLLGLASSSAFAATPSNAETQAQLDAMKAKISKMETVLQQNQAGGFQQTNDWFNRITLSGEANVDGVLANRSLITKHHSRQISDNHSSDINLSNASLFVDFIASDWTKGHMALTYRNATPVNNYYSVNSHNTVMVDEAYVTIGNFTKSPFYFMAGKQYVNFGDYHRYPMVASLSQLLEETNVTAARVGFVDASGFNASASLFRGIHESKKVDGINEKRAQNFAVNAGFASQYDNLGYRVGVSYIRNMADTNYINEKLDDAGYRSKVGAISAYAGVNSGPFDAGVNYVTALQSFDQADIGYTGAETRRGAKPAAWNIDAGYSFMTLGHQSRVGLGYEGSKEAIEISATGMPKTRYQANYTVNVSKYTDVGFQLYYDRDYSENVGGTGKNAVTGVARLAVKFA